MPVTDRMLLQHILDAAHEAISFAKGKNEGEVAVNRMLLLSIVKDIEIIGEAASKVSKETRAYLSEIPWQDLIGMRNRLIHAYFDIDSSIVWEVAVHDLPRLVQEIENAINSCS